MVEIKFSRTIDYGAEGRNGYSKITGMFLTNEPDIVVIYPRNSKGKRTVCRMTIPKEDIDKFVDELLKLK